jgi:hypothetical protein
VARSIIDAIKQGDWTFEPASREEADSNATAALPGTAEKIDVLARRLAEGEPLFHPRDRLTFDQLESNGTPKADRP